MNQQLQSLLTRVYSGLLNNLRYFVLAVLLLGLSLYMKSKEAGVVPSGVSESRQSMAWWFVYLLLVGVVVYYHRRGVWWKSLGWGAVQGLWLFLVLYLVWSFAGHLLDPVLDPSFWGGAFGAATGVFPKLDSTTPTFPILTGGGVLGLVLLYVVTRKRVINYLKPDPNVPTNAHAVVDILAKGMSTAILVLALWYVIYFISSPNARSVMESWVLWLGEWKPHTELGIVLAGTYFYARCVDKPVPDFVLLIRDGLHLLMILGVLGYIAYQLHRHGFF